jgi:hypothetical protein
MDFDGLIAVQTGLGTAALIVIIPILNLFFIVGRSMIFSIVMMLEL